MQKIDFADGRIRQNILQTAFPMLVAQVLNLLYSIVDRVYIGRIAGTGTLSLGAVGLCFPVIMIINGFTNMFGMGGSPIFAMALGAGQQKKAEEVLQTSFRMLCYVSLVITAAGELLGSGLLQLFGATAEELPISLAYLQIYLLGTLPLMVSTGLNPFINAMGYSVIAMISVTIGAAANLILDPVLIFGLHMGVRGAAVATVISQFFSLFFVLYFMKKPEREYRISLGRKLPHLYDIVTLGTAPFIMQCTNSLVQITNNRVLMQTGGVLFVSVMTIVSSVRSILDVPVMAITEGTSPVISYNYGARRPLKVREAIRYMMKIVLPYTAIVWILILLLPSLFISIFSHDPVIAADASHALRLYFAAFIFQSLQYGGQTVFKALNFRRYAIFFSLLRKVVLVVPFVYILAYGMKLGTAGVFLAEPVSNVIGGTACFVTMRFVLNRTMTKMVQENNARKNK